MKMKALFALSIFCYASALFGVEGREVKEIVMGYNDSAKTPLIAAAPDNSGAYLDLYSRVAEKIGYKLKVVRYPKKRVYLLMKEGKIDFYPGMKYDQKRAKLAYFIPNGLPTGRTGISRLDLSEITDFSQLQGKRVIMPFDGIDYTEGADGISITRVRKLDIEKAYELLVNDRADFYATDDVVVATFLEGLKTNNLRIHSNILPPAKMTLGFSRSSPYFRAVENPAYDPARGRGVENDPWIPEKGSLVHKMQEALREMIRDGEIGAIYKSYFKFE